MSNFLYAFRFGTVNTISKCYRSANVNGNNGLVYKVNAFQHSTNTKSETFLLSSKPNQPGSQKAKKSKQYEKLLKVLEDLPETPKSISSNVCKASEKKAELFARKNVSKEKVPVVTKKSPLNDQAQDMVKKSAATSTNTCKLKQQQSFNQKLAVNDGPQQNFDFSINAEDLVNIQLLESGYDPFDGECSHLASNISKDTTISFDANIPVEESRNYHTLKNGLDLNCLEPEIAKDVLKEEVGEEEETEKAKTKKTADVISKKNEKKLLNNLTVAMRKKISKTRTKELDQAAKKINFNWNLKSYVDICVNANMLMKAHNCLQYYRMKSNYSKKVPKIEDIQIYNSVMHGWAKKGNLIRVKELFDALQEQKILPNVQSYAAYLECLGRKEDLKASEVSNILTKMQKQGYSPEQLFKECIFVRDQRETVIKSIKCALPDFKPNSPDHPKGYECRVLEVLNNDCLSVPHTPCGNEVTQAQLKSWLNEQLEWEKHGCVTVKSIENHRVNDTIVKLRKQISECEKHWREILLKSFVKRISIIKNQVRNDNEISLYPYLIILEPHYYVDSLMQEIQELALSSETFSPSVNVLYYNLGNKIMLRYFTWEKQQYGISDKIVSLYNKYLEYVTDPERFCKQTPRETWQQIKMDNPEGPTINKPKELWPSDVVTSIGKLLYDLLLYNVKIDVKILHSTSDQKQLFPAFYQICRNMGKMSKMEIKPHPALSKLYKSACLEDITVDVNIVPMVVPPLPWTSVQSGGFLLFEAQFVRLVTNSFQQRRLLEETCVQQFHPSFDSLNVLGMCPWKINKPMLDLIISIFQDKGWEELDIPVRLSEFPQPPPLVPGASKEEKHKIVRERLAWSRKRAETYSQWCDVLYKLSIANKFRDRIFWLPHNLDFRGRAYPCPPHFSHIGGDMARSILVFAQGKPLGEDGLNWLKVHLINLTGLKKRESVAERLKFADEMMPEILDSADNPITGNKWWTKSDDPWQTLACCKEVANATRSLDPRAFVSHFPIHQDGSCNGLQHYAALGRDQEGAEQVNLYPHDKPQDVYSAVAAMVEEERAKDAAKGHKIATALEGFVKRKVVKRPVMTVVYGVTQYGANLQVLKEIEDMPEFPQDLCWQASRYLVDKIFLSLRRMFTATKHIQDWFTDCANVISKVCNQPVQWVTPLGFPVIQPYYAAFPKMSIHKQMHNVHIMAYSDIPVRINSMKQKNAFPPNFIHSLDSCHMMMTSLFCQREGITFVSVHDCFWTHACTVNAMNLICREQFVALHSEPILSDLSKYLLEQFGFPDSECHGNKTEAKAKKLVNATLSSVPKTGSFELNNVLKSVYFFS